MLLLIADRSNTYELKFKTINSDICSKCVIERETRIRVAARKPSFLIERGKKREVIMITRENYKQESEGTLHVG